MDRELEPWMSIKNSWKFFFFATESVAKNINAGISHVLLLNQLFKILLMTVQCPALFQ